MSSSPDPVLGTVRAYDESAELWSSMSADRAAWRQNYDRFARLVLPDAFVLDLGCGSGLDAPGLSDRGLRLSGLDISGQLLALALRQAALVGSLVLGDLRSLPYADASFDGIWADGSLHHVPKRDFGTALLECHRVLRQGGILLASLEEGSGEGFAHLNPEKIRAARWYSFWKAEEVFAALDRVGFEISGLGGAGPSAIAVVARKLA